MTPSSSAMKSNEHQLRSEYPNLPTGVASEGRRLALTPMTYKFHSADGHRYKFKGFPVRDHNAWPELKGSYRHPEFTPLRLRIFQTEDGAVEVLESESIVYVNLFNSLQYYSKSLFPSEVQQRTADAIGESLMPNGNLNPNMFIPPPTVEELAQRARSGTTWCIELRRVPIKILRAAHKELRDEYEHASRRPITTEEAIETEGIVKHAKDFVADAKSDALRATIALTKFNEKHWIERLLRAKEGMGLRASKEHYESEIAWGSKALQQVRGRPSVIANARLTANLNRQDYQACQITMKIGGQKIEAAIKQRTHTLQQEPAACSSKRPIRKTIM